MCQIIATQTNSIQQILSQAVNDRSQTISGNFPKIEVSKEILKKAKKESAKPLSKLQFHLFKIIKEDCAIQGYCNRSITEFVNITGKSKRGVLKALSHLNSDFYINSKRGGRDDSCVRVLAGKPLPPPKVRKKKSAPKSAPMESSIPYKISYSEKEKEKEDLLARDLITNMTNKEEKTFKELGLSALDEKIILNAIKAKGLNEKTRTVLTQRVLHAHYKNTYGLNYPRRYYLEAIENERM